MRRIIFKILIILLIINVTFLGSLKQIAYADSTMTRSEMRDYVAATAISYYNLNKYTDYERYSMDRSNKSFSWVNYKVSPENLNRGNFVTTACAAFTSMVYFYSLNYNFSEYYDVSPNNLLNKNREDYINKYYNNGLGPSTGFFAEIASYDLSKNNKYGIGVYNNDKILDYYDNEKEKCKIYMELIGDKSLDYYKNNCTSYNFTDINNNYKLQKGDIFVVRRKTPDNKPSGHALLYIDNYNGVKGFLHSTGYDFEPNKNPISLHLDDQAVYFLSLNDFVNKYFFTEKSNGTKFKQYTILRPINRFCDGDKCYYKEGTNNPEKGVMCNTNKNKKCTAEISPNIYARKEFKDLSIEQYITNASNKILTMNYSSTNDDTSLVYRLELKGINKKVSGISISADIPANASIVECVGSYKDKCNIDKNKGKITWTGVSVDNNKKINIGFRARNFNDSIVNFSGFNITINNKILKMDKIETPVLVTMNYKNATNIKNYYNSFNGNCKSLICFFRVYNDIYSTIIPAFKFVDVRDAIFLKNSKTSSYYHRRTEAESKNLNSDQLMIEKMMVPGLYGGQKVSDDTRKDRVRYLSANNLEVGDIVVGSRDGKNTAFIYLGEESNCTSFKSGCSILGSISDGKMVISNKSTTPTARRVFRETYAKDWFVVLRPSRIIQKVIVTHKKEKLNGEDSVSKDKYYLGNGYKFTPEPINYTGYATPKKKTIVVSEDNHNIEYKYNLISYLIDVVAGDNVSTTNGTGSYKYGSKATISATPNEGYTITNWITDSDNNWNCHKNSCIITVRKKTTYTAIANPNKYKITLKSDNKTVKSFYVYYKGEIGTVDVPKKTGYTFKGYYSKQNILYYDKNGKAERKWDIASNADLYARWENNNYTVKYNANGGTGTVSDSTHVYGEEKKLNANKFKRTGYFFIGWNTNKNATSAIYADEAKVKNLTSVNNDKVTLYAIWAPDTNVKYKVRYWKDYVSGDKYYVWSSKYYYGVTDSVVSPVPETIYGYTTPAKQTVTIKGDGSTVVDYYYNRKSYTLSLKKGTGIKTVSGDGTYKYWEEHEIKSTLKTGYTFVNWTDANNKEINNQEIFIENRRYKNDLFTANARPNTYVVTYNCNGCTGGDISDDSFTYDKEYRLKRNVFERDNYIFLGWSKNKDSKVIDYSDQQKVSNLSSVDGGVVELFAVWKEKEETTPPEDGEEPIIIVDPPQPVEPKDEEEKEEEKTTDKQKQDENKTTPEEKENEKDINDEITWEEEEEENTVVDSVEEPSKTNKKVNYIPIVLIACSALLITLLFIVKKRKRI